MRVGNQWQDVAIRNVSSRGMLLSADDPPPEGEYIEIRKAMMVVVARAVWVKGEIFGIRTQDRVDLSELLEKDGSKPREWKPQAGEERRQRNRPEETADRSRQRARQFQFALVATSVIGVAAFLAYQVAARLGTPFAAVRSALGG